MRMFSQRSLSPRGVLSFDYASCTQDLALTHACGLPFCFPPCKSVFSALAPSPPFTRPPFTFSTAVTIVCPSLPLRTPQFCVCVCFPSHALFFFSLSPLRFYSFFLLVLCLPSSSPDTHTRSKPSPLYSRGQFSFFFASLFDTAPTPEKKK